MKIKILFVLFLIVGVAFVIAQIYDQRTVFSAYHPTSEYTYNQTGTTEPAGALYYAYKLPKDTKITFDMRIDELNYDSITFQLLRFRKNPVSGELSSTEIMTKTLDSDTWPDNSYSIEIKESAWAFAFGVKSNSETLAKMNSCYISGNTIIFPFRWNPLIDNFVTPDADTVSAFLTYDSK